MTETSLKIERILKLLTEEKKKPSLVEEFAKCLTEELTPMELWSSEIHDRIQAALDKGNWLMFAAIGIIYGKNALERIAEKFF